MNQKAAAPGTAAGAPGGKDGMNKMEAVKQALAKLGKNAMPVDIQGYVKKEFGIDMTTDHVSNYKGKLLRGKGKGRTKAKPAAAKASTPKPAAKKPAAKKPAPKAAAPKAIPSGISLRDIESVKGLVGRVGTAQLRSLVDLLAK
jgi:hypothetical protein